MFGSLLNALNAMSFSQILATGLLGIIICMSLFHFYMNCKVGPGRKNYRSQYLFLNYCVKFVLLGGLIYTFEESILLHTLYSAITFMILWMMCMILGRMQLHYFWEFGGRNRRRVVSSRDMVYHLGHDLYAFFGIQIMLVAGLLAPS